jgi:hypothetical protein
VTPGNDLRSFFNMLYGGEPEGSFAEVRYVRQHSTGMGQSWFGVRDSERWARAIEGLAKTDVYVGIAPRIRREGTKAAVERVHCLWADVDGLDGLDALREFTPLPAIVIRSGSPGSVHAYWPLLDPVGPDEAERGNRRIANAIGSDMKSTDAARILRPPGTSNFKHSPAASVVTARFEVEVFSYDQVVGDLDDPPARVARPVGPGPRGDEGIIGAQDAAVTLIERYSPETQLWSSGSGRLHGRCPFDFHDDRNPSFGLFDDGGYICSCGSGDIVRLFVQLRGEQFSNGNLPTYKRELRDELGLVAA